MGKTKRTVNKNSSTRELPKPKKVKLEDREVPLKFLEEVNQYSIIFSVEVYVTF